MVNGAVQVVLFLGFVGHVRHVRAEPASTKEIDRAAGCATNPAVVGRCFEVQGRAVVGDGTLAFRITQAGTQRVFGVPPAENEIVPACLAKAVTPTSEVTGEFLVCPFTAAKEGDMQMVCVESVGELTVRRWDNGKRGYFVDGPVPGCALPTSDLGRHWRDGMPADVVGLVERFAGCNHWAGEEGYSEERRKEIEDNVNRLRCERLEADQRKLRKKYARKPPVLRVIDAANDYEGD
ncbi:MAG TPA: hypothetical protein VHO06_01605 [Polyangia bacterium]|nr:hypothetical protein [Polyangia bacterium]